MQSSLNTLLAFDTATERSSIALAAHGRVWERDGAGGAQASAAFLPALLALLAEAEVTLHDLDAIAFGRGPGAFTGLRVAAAVAQGLAFGAAKPVLPIDTLLAVAEDARAGAEALRVWVVVDARMNEIYAAEYDFGPQGWTVRNAPMLATAEALNRLWRQSPPEVVAGNALAAFAAQLESGDAHRLPEARPRALGMLALAQASWAAGGAVDAAFAVPLYVRDKVAQTSAEREDKGAVRAPAP